MSGAMDFEVQSAQLAQMAKGGKKRRKQRDSECKNQHAALQVCIIIEPCYIYGGTPSIWTPLGQNIVS